VIVLALTCSTAKATVGLYSETETLIEKFSDNPKRHSEFLNQAIENCLNEKNISWSQIDVIAVDHGPGSFTGIRVACNIARALCYSLEKPVFHTHSLNILLQSSHPGKDRLALLNAYKNMVFFNSEVGGNISSPEVAQASDLQSKIQGLFSLPVPCVGEGYSVYQQVLGPSFQEIPGSDRYPEASALAQLAQLHKNEWTKDWKLIIPLYIRASAAEENKEIF